MKVENPKDKIGRTKVPLAIVPITFLTQAAVALFNGKEKYGLVNWRATNVSAMVYLDAACRHLYRWIAGQERDPDDNVHNLAGAAACICIVIDAWVCGTLVDDRPLHIPEDILNNDQLKAQADVAHLANIHSDKNPTHHTQKMHDDTDELVEASKTAQTEPEGRQAMPIDGNMYSADPVELAVKPVTVPAVAPHFTSLADLAPLRKTD